MFFNIESNSLAILQHLRRSRPAAYSSEGWYAQNASCLCRARRSLAFQHHAGKRQILKHHLSHQTSLYAATKRKGSASVRYAPQHAHHKRSTDTGQLFSPQSAEYLLAILVWCCSHSPGKTLSETKPSSAASDDISGAAVIAACRCGCYRWCGCRFPAPVPKADASARSAVTISELNVSK